MNKKYKKIIIVLLLFIQMMQLFMCAKPVHAQVKENDEITLLGDHECDSLVEYFMTNENRWSYKIVYYVYYNDDGNVYPAFCVEPAKNGVGTGYDSYTATIKKVENVYEEGVQRLNQIWRILSKGYMGSKWSDWASYGIECDDDFYSANKIALHSLAEGIPPEEKYVLGNRSVDGNSVEEIQRRGEAVLNLAIELYNYALNGTDVYEEPNIEIKENGEYEIKTIQGQEYYVQNYILKTNRNLLSYNIFIQDFPEGTKILDSENREISNSNCKNIKIAIPTNKIKKDINGKISIEDAYIKTNPIYYCESNEEGAQSYVTYNNSYEPTEAEISLKIKANTAELLIKKIDEETKEPLAGVEFEILNSIKEKIAIITTDENGEGKLTNLYPQIIYIKEIKTKDGYVLTNEERKVILEYGKQEVITIGNEKTVEEPKEQEILEQPELPKLPRTGF